MKEVKKAQTEAKVEELKEQYRNVDKELEIFRKQKVAKVRQFYANKESEEGRKSLANTANHSAMSAFKKKTASSPDLAYGLEKQDKRFTSKRISLTLQSVGDDADSTHIMMTYPDQDDSVVIADTPTMNS